MNVERVFPEEMGPIERIDMNIREKIAEFQEEIIEIESWKYGNTPTRTKRMRGYLLYETSQCRYLGGEHRALYGDMLNFFSLLYPGWGGFDYDFGSNYHGATMVTMKGESNKGGGSSADIVLPYALFTAETDMDLIRLYAKAYRDHMARGGKITDVRVINALDWTLSIELSDILREAVGKPPTSDDDINMR